MRANRSLIIGIAGPSGSGKTTLANKINDRFGKNSCTVIPMDNYYYDLSHLTNVEKNTHNYDHPDAIDFSSLINDLRMAHKKGFILMPVYDFEVHERKRIKERIEIKKILIIEGILLFTNDELNKLLDYKIFLNTPLDVCLLRRIRRDMLERKRTLDSIYYQYLDTIKPMYLQFVRKTMKNADLVLDGEKCDVLEIVSIIENLMKLDENS